MASRALIVEDSMLIALDAEGCLLDLGVADVTVCGTVADALGALKAESFDFALLDYNLGTESSEDVARELKARDVPFWIATGYGEMEDKRDELGARGLLIKPYGSPELKTIVESVSATG